MKMIMSKLVVATIAMTGFMFCGCNKTASQNLSGSKNVSTVTKTSHGYTVDCQITSKDEIPIFAVTVRGKPDKISVILFKPDGDSESGLIYAEEMISGVAKKSILMPKPAEGSYSLVVKIFSSDKVIYKKDFVWTLEEITIGNVNFEFEQIKSPWGKKNDSIEFSGISMSVNKKGNIPVRFTASEIIVNGSEWNSIVNPGSPVIIGTSGETGIMILQLRNIVNPGNKISVSGKLFINGSEKEFVAFEKTTIVSQNVDQSVNRASNADTHDELAQNANTVKEQNVNVNLGRERNTNPDEAVARFTSRMQKLRELAASKSAK